MSFPHRHLLGIAPLTPAEIGWLLDAAESMIGRDVPAAPVARVQINAFFENSTRTLMSFGLAGRRLGLHVLDFGVAGSSVAKGETLGDTARTLAALGADVIVMRHGTPGAADEVVRAVEPSGCAVINAGDGINEHPTQALIDALVLRRRFGRLEGLTVAICGDIRHSRVARSNMLLLTRMGARVRVTGPAILLPAGAVPEGVSVVPEFAGAIEGADAVMMLRVQHERMADRLNLAADAYHADHGLTWERLNAASPHAIVMHPGPVNRDVEIAGALADDPARSVILQQVALGVPVRMACLQAVLS
jgi:aspartate carbamoyltransferase catalytic subunit